jgi:hypothetical protein
MPVRTTRRKTVLALGGAAAAALAAASLAIAQVGAPPQFDGTPPALPAPPAPNLKQTNCGPNQSSIVRTQNLPSITNSVAFVPLAGANTQVVVPDGQSRCVKVLFTAETACTGWVGGPDFCYVQALADGMPMDPDGTGFQAIDSEDDTASAHAYQWVTRLGEGVHTIRLERRVGNPNTMSSYDDWTFDTQVYL